MSEIKTEKAIEYLKKQKSIFESKSRNEEAEYCSIAISAMRGTLKKEVPAEVKARFDKFYSAYPKHKAPDDALKAFKALNVTDELLNQIIASVEIDKKSYSWEDEKFIPYPAVYLRKGMYKSHIADIKADENDILAAAMCNVPVLR